MTGKYAPLFRFLANFEGREWSATFAEVERILGKPLPPSARRHREWWANNKSPGGHVQSRAWLRARWRKRHIDLERESVTFVRVSGGIPAARAASPRRAHHEFEPTTYHNTFGWHEPPLTVQPGDSVRTSTVDARGGDRHGDTVAKRGNPQSGPFAVAGAEPGDTLVVTLDRVRITRSWGFSSSALAANVLEFDDVPRFADEAHRSFWDIDVEAGTVRLQPPERAPAGEPTPARNRIHDVALPLRTMVGCVAVAPPGRQHISTATSGPFGGNMDYNGVVEGLRLYFPVFAPGGLFHIGDGHALQGDGEMDGTGVEVPMDVTFTLDLIKGKTIEWPRFENDTHLMTAGNLRPLDQAVQHATSEMVRWLEADYGLTTREAHLLLGRMVEYDLGNMFDPAYTMICKLRKDVLRQVAEG